MKEAYIIGKKFGPAKLALIDVCDKIVSEYAAKGMLLTVRQIYYQLVSRAKVENTVQSYDRVQALLNDARLAGMIDWDSIEDRTRGITERSHWRNGGEILKTAANTYFQDMWATQPYRVFVVIEKEALSAVAEIPCSEYDVPLLPARGYPSASTLRELAKTRIMPARQQIVVLHLGDHDPSGMDMSRDLEERLTMFSRSGMGDIDFRRIALNMDQVQEQNPPPNPAKTTDCRYEGYREKYGEESWELDALTPEYIYELIKDQIVELIDWDAWEIVQNEIDDVRTRLATIAENFDKDKK